MGEVENNPAKLGRTCSQKIGALSSAQSWAKPQYVLEDYARIDLDTRYQRNAIGWSRERNLSSRSVLPYHLVLYLSRKELCCRRREQPCRVMEEHVLKDWCLMSWAKLRYWKMHCWSLTVLVNRYWLLIASICRWIGASYYIDSYHYLPNRLPVRLARPKHNWNCW